VRPRFVTEVLDGVFDRALLLPGGFTVDNAAGGAVNGGTLTFTAQSLAPGASAVYSVALHAPGGFGFGFTAAYAFPANPDPFIQQPGLGLQPYGLTRAQTVACGFSPTRLLRTIELMNAAPMKPTPISPVTTSGTSYSMVINSSTASAPMAQCAPCSRYT